MDGTCFLQYTCANGSRLHPQSLMIAAHSEWEGTGSSPDSINVKAVYSAGTEYQEQDKVELKCMSLQVPEQLGSHVGLEPLPVTC